MRPKCDNRRKHHLVPCHRIPDQGKSLRARRNPSNKLTLFTIPSPAREISDILRQALPSPKNVRAGLFLDRCWKQNINPRKFSTIHNVGYGIFSCWNAITLWFHMGTHHTVYFTNLRISASLTFSRGLIFGYNSSDPSPWGNVFGYSYEKTRSILRFSRR